ncbi:MAG: HNH endonuclease [Planctomycetota bacterium]|jgi:5-methylcytosine-specific restriction endonuclease McrA
MLDSEGCVLDERTLVLNRSWVAITTTTVRNALSMVYQGAAKVICANTYQAHDFHSWAEVGAAWDEPGVRTISVRVRVPEIIVLAVYDGFPQRTVAFSRRNLYRRDRFTCQYCGERPGTEELTIDHVVPRSRGGRSTWQNCVLACVDCNKRKANRLPAEAGVRLSRPPNVPRWSWDVEVAVGHRKSSWGQFLSDHYWNVELEN